MHGPTVPQGSQAAAALLALGRGVRHSLLSERLNNGRILGQYLPVDRRPVSTRLRAQSTISARRSNSSPNLSRKTIRRPRSTLSNRMPERPHATWRKHMPRLRPSSNLIASVTPEFLPRCLSIAIQASGKTGRQFHRGRHSAACHEGTPIAGWNVPRMPTANFTAGEGYGKVVVSRCAARPGPGVTAIQL
jgi:hypothetical protein